MNKHCSEYMPFDLLHLDYGAHLSPILWGKLFTLNGQAALLVETMSDKVMQDKTVKFSS